MADIYEKKESNGDECSSAEKLADTKISETSTDSTKKKRKEDRSYEYILRALSSLSTPEEKLTALCKKYADLYEENRVSKEQNKILQKKTALITREKELMQSESSKAVLAKNKLETLCRELQKQNKQTKDDSITRTKIEEEKRREVTAKFQTTITDIQAQMGEYHTRNSTLRDENQSLAEKLKGFIDQYEVREQHVDKVMKTHELESQLAEAKLKKSEYELEEEKIKWETEKNKLLEENALLKKQCELLDVSEKRLREQIDFYKTKYEEFHSTLTQSNDVFASCKSEMTKMSKRMKKVEKESVEWRSKWESSSKTVIELADQKVKQEKEITLLRNKLSKLENLCRALQTERVQLLKNKTDDPSEDPSQANKEKKEETSIDTPTETKKEKDTEEDSPVTNTAPSTSSNDQESSHEQPSSLPTSNASDTETLD